MVTVRNNEDPLLSTFHPLQNSSTVSAVASSSVLLTSIPHLYRLANFPVVIHVALEPTPIPDYSAISSIRQCGFTFLHSETLQEAQDIALTAHALAHKSGKGVIHFFDPANSVNDGAIAEENVEVVQKVLNLSGNATSHSEGLGGQTLYADSGRVATVTEEGVEGVQNAPAGTSTPEQRASHTPPNVSTDNSSVGSSRRDSSADSRAPSSSAATTIDNVSVRPVNSADIFEWTTQIWGVLSETVGRKYNAIEYTGPADAKSAIFVFGSTGVFVDVLSNAEPNSELGNIGLITARLYRP